MHIILWHSQYISYVAKCTTVGAPFFEGYKFHEWTKKRKFEETIFMNLHWRWPRSKAAILAQERYHFQYKSLV